MPLRSAQRLARTFKQWTGLNQPRIGGYVALGGWRRRCGTSGHVGALGSLRYRFGASTARRVCGTATCLWHSSGVNLLDAVVPLLALGGTSIQAYQGLRQLKEVDPEAHRAFVAIDDLKIEYAMTRHPVRWYERRREMAQLLRESPAEAKLYKRVRLQLVSWMLLFFASVVSVITAFFA